MSGENRVGNDGQELGIFKVENCGVLCDHHHVGALLKAANSLWDKGVEDRPEIEGNRGYIKHGGEAGVKELYVEDKRGFSFGSKGNKGGGNAMRRKNVWATGMKTEDREMLEEGFEELSLLAERIAHDILLEELNMSNEGVEKLLRGGKEISLLRVFQYFGQENSERGEGKSKSTIGSSPHTDWGFLTLILELGSNSQLENGGLEYFDGKSWNYVNPVKNTVTVNFGDYLSAISNSTVNSPIHRVSLGKEDRTSLVFFYYPSFDAKMITKRNDREIDIGSEYNTCGGVDDLNMKFGEWLIKKWSDVQVLVDEDE